MQCHKMKINEYLNTPQCCSDYGYVKCKDKDSLHKCPKFLDSLVEERETFVRENGLCFSGLGSGHVVKWCKSSGFNALFLPKQTGLLPREPIRPRNQWSYLEGLKLADPKFDSPGNHTMPGGSLEIVETVFEWVLYQPVDTRQNNYCNCALCTIRKNPPISDIIRHDLTCKNPRGESNVKDLYVDILLSVPNSVSEAIKLQSELIKLLNIGGFELRQFNHCAGMDSITSLAMETFVANGVPMIQDHVESTQWCLVDSSDNPPNERNRFLSLATDVLHQMLFHWCLKEGKPVSAKSHIASLCPYCSYIPEEHKYPTLLPKPNELVEQIIWAALVTNLHAGLQLVQAIIQQRFCILDARNIIRQTVKKCVRCHFHKKKSAKQLVGDLPAVRVQPACPFLHCGLYYARPLNLHNCKGQVTCSDCGTTFVSSAREPKELFVLMNREDSEQAVGHLAKQQGISWHFNPLAAPHKGGLWGAGVKSMTYHLHCVIGSSRLTFKVVYTVLAFVEACLNSRPCTMTAGSTTSTALLATLVSSVSLLTQSVAVEAVGEGVELADLLVLMVWVKTATGDMRETCVQSGTIAILGMTEINCIVPLLLI
ncbi:hypothetical protein PR048_013309 [Dryococelus australis]|uniref:Uncharacterized protein n=1 Tax=Dryococelus australis TaxID=614101 RepID=A0ABQ9HSM1_9NEOP|nr:hypothetical protein PR048_013309 [Dryococelus australis]